MVWKNAPIWRAILLGRPWCESGVGCVGKRTIALRCGGGAKVAVNGAKMRRTLGGPFLWCEGGAKWSVRGPKVRNSIRTVRNRGDVVRECVKDGRDFFRREESKTLQRCPYGGIPSSNGRKPAARGRCPPGFYC